MDTFTTPPLVTTPNEMSIGDLRQRAMAAGAKMYPGKALKLESSRLMFYRTGLLKGVPGECALVRLGPPR